jgi:hypothetical protein
MEKVKNRIKGKVEEIGLIQAIEAMLPLETEIKLKEPEMTLQIKVLKVKLDKKDSYFGVLIREVKEDARKT